ncbi:MAG: hypothetical protein N2439_12910 [Anaerolineae bacterium]|nr:hypothetical protein [Anaerolineae bacterium]
MSRWLLKLAYQLQHHYLGEWPLDRWGVAGALLAAGVIVLQWWARGRPPLPVWHWLVLALILLAACGLLYLRRWAGRRMYVQFTADPTVSAPVPQPLAARDKVAVRATALFEVEGKAHFFADLMAYWRTFNTREHAVMAIAHRSRFLLLGTVPERLLGMWYVFFKPEMIEEIAAGTLMFGATQRPALRVAYQAPGNARARKPNRPQTQVVYLGFADETERAQVWADLLADAPPYAPRTAT